MLGTVVSDELDAAAAAAPMASPAIDVPSADSTGLPDWVAGSVAAGFSRVVPQCVQKRAPSRTEVPHAWHVTSEHPGQTEPRSARTRVLCRCPADLRSHRLRSSSAYLLAVLPERMSFDCKRQVARRLTARLPIDPKPPTAPPVASAEVLRHRLDVASDHQAPDAHVILEPTGLDVYSSNGSY